MAERSFLAIAVSRFADTAILVSDSPTGAGSIHNTGERAVAGFGANALAREADAAVWEAVLRGCLEHVVTLVQSLENEPYTSSPGTVT
ncbi:hypothetical protein F2Q65_01400 [Thiohalocapsa marina]|uniref:Uncharacterized protein n=1 Tax=Thiohalocapsa marina TaxID=424902 RepID=A0A5M8FVX0_9GAMM|nr:hypothetical protein [Thiohalocapsa marina]KAA6187913.1 hypothetical protein F2Q65_01400 [Thiohalocapsa marina]